MTFQGFLTENGAPANGYYHIQHEVFTQFTGGSAIPGSLSSQGLEVTNGLFTVGVNVAWMLDTSQVQPGLAPPRYLEVRFRPGSSTDPHTVLQPRLLLASAPYAMRAAISAGTFAEGIIGTLDSSQLPTNLAQLNTDQTFLGAAYFSNAVSFSLAPAFITTNTAPFSVTSTSLVTHLNADLLDGLSSSQFWRLDGNAGVAAGTHFLGTTDFAALELRVNQWPALRLEPGFSEHEVNLVGGSPSNTITSGGGNFIGGGGGGGGDAHVLSGNHSVIVGGTGNRQNGTRAFIGGGSGNVIASGGGTGDVLVGGSDNRNATFGFGTLVGGEENLIEGSYSFLGGGHRNTANGQGSVVTGGRLNTNTAPFAVLGGGEENVLNGWHGVIVGGYLNQLDATYSVIAGGAQNLIEGGASYTFIAGQANRISPGAEASVIAGGSENLIGTNASFATIPGGRWNQAVAPYSLAAGSRAQALHHGSFVWADGFLPSTPFASTNDNEFAVRATGGVRLATAIDGAGEPTAGVAVAPGSGSWSSLSDRAAKENLAPVDGREILARVAALPLATWNYRTQSDTVRHLGPMADDFRSAFGLGENARTISTVDADGVALAAIQGLNTRLTEELARRDAENVTLRRELEELKRLILNRHPKTSQP